MDYNIYELQGDEIAVECTYNTTNRSKVTKVPYESSQWDLLQVHFLWSQASSPSSSGVVSPLQMGLATTDEMCLAFLFYYPLIKVAWCTSSPNTTHPLINMSDQYA